MRCQMMSWRIAGKRPNTKPRTLPLTKVTRSSKKMWYVLHTTRSESVFIFLKIARSSSSSVLVPYKFARRGPRPRAEHDSPEPDDPSHSLNAISNSINFSRETLAAITRTVLSVIQEKNAGIQDVPRRGRKVRSEKIKMLMIREKNDDRRKKIDGKTSLSITKHE